MQIAYAIGVARPVGVYVDTFGTGVVDEEKISKYVLEKFDMRPRAIIEELDLLRPIYRQTAAYGHFGRKDFPWESTQRAAELRDALIDGNKTKVAVSKKEDAKDSKKEGKKEGKKGKNGSSAEA